MENDPLDRRSSSRRQRRADREAVEAAEAAENDESGSAAAAEQQQAVPSLPEATALAAAIPRGPSDDIERRIAESIAKRTKSNAAAAIMEEYHDTQDHDNDVENEILGNYEYLDHTADIQIHSWGDSFNQALEGLAQAMFGYQTRKLSLIEINQEESAALGSNVRVEAHDRESLVYNFLQEWLCRFHESGFVPREVTVQSVDLENYTVVSSGRGERMKTDKHLQGTEVSVFCKIIIAKSPPRKLSSSCLFYLLLYNPVVKVKAITYSNLQVIQDENNRNRIDIWVILDI